MEIYKKIGLKIMYARKSKGIKQLELAEMMKLSRASLTNIETGRQRITIDKLYLISKITGFKISEFIDDSGDELPIKPPFVPNIKEDVLFQLDKIPEKVLKGMIKLYKTIEFTNKTEQ